MSNNYFTNYTKNYSPFRKQSLYKKFSASYNFTKDDKMETQGQRIRKIRQALNLSQEDFGKIFDITKQFVSGLEKDKTFLNNDKLVKLLFDYNVNINYLLGGFGEMFNAPASKNIKEDILKEISEILKKRGF